MRLALEGRLENVPVADVLSFVRHTRRTALVVFERPDQETRTFCAEGDPVWAVSSRPQLQLESRLSSQGRLKLREIEASLMKHQTGPHRIPQALVADGLYAPDAMLGEMRALATDVLKDATTWNAGTFVVYDHVHAPPFVPHLDAGTWNRLLVETLRSELDDAAMLKEFQNKKLRIAPRRKGVAYSLNADENVTLGAIDGTRAAAEIAAEGGQTEAQAARNLHVLRALRLAEFIEIHAPAEKVPTSATRRPAPSKPASGPGIQAAPAPPPPPAPPPARPRQSPEAITNKFHPVDVKPGTGEEKTHLLTVEETRAAVSGPPPARPPKAETRPAAPAAPPPPQTVQAPPAPPPLPAKTEPPPRLPAGSKDDPTAELPTMKREEPKEPKRIRRLLEYALDDKPHSYELRGEVVTVGRHPKNDLTVQDARVSSFHCKLERDGAEFSVVDLKSRNGTFVNASRVERMRLKAGDEIRLGGLRLRYVVEK
jgi:hypothetical protein